MKLTGARLTNIACFEDLSLDFTDAATGKPAPWVVLLGENGTGKSTILQMLGAGMLGPYLLPIVANEVDWRQYARLADHSSDATSWLATTFISDIIDEGFEGAASYEMSLYMELISSNIPEFRMYNHPFDITMYQSNLLGGWFACGYSPWRRALRSVGGNSGSFPTLDDSAKPFRFASLFGNDSALTQVGDWLAGLYFRTLHPSRTPADEDRHQRAIVALEQALPGVSIVEITADRKVMVEEADVRVSLDRLSDGYRSTLAWVGDLIRRLFDAYPDSDNPLHESGVVLIDEIDLHLHPTWQRSVVERVRRTFPNLQFIVTSHSPFVAQDMRPQDRIIVLERTGRNGRGPVVAREEPGAIHGWTADQILSGYFGLRRGTRGEQAQKEEVRYERLLDADATGSLTEAQRAELNRLRERMDKLPLGDTPDAQELFAAADTVLEAFRRQREAQEAAITTATISPSDELSQDAE